MRFPFVDLAAQYEGIREEVTEAILRTMESQRFIHGPEVDAFEKEIAEWNGSRFAIGCASGSDALLLALMALNIKPGDEVVTTSFTFVATIGAIVRLGATPVFVDVEPHTFNLDPLLLEKAITERTRAVIPIHLYGLPADMDPILAICGERRIPVVEDAAQAIGATYKSKRAGNLGVINCFSFFPSKNLGAAGDGGLITTDDGDLAEQLRVFANHGSRKRYYYDLIGFNSRLDNLQAAILRVKLRYLDGWIAGRQKKAEGYRPLKEFVATPVVPSDRTHVYHQYTIRAAERDALKAHLTECGIPSEIYYPLPLHLQTAYRYLGYRVGDFPETERAAREVLSLPIYPELTNEQQGQVLAAVASFYGGSGLCTSRSLERRESK